MVFKRLRELNRDELQKKIDYANETIKKLEKMKQEDEYINSANVMRGLDMQIQSEQKDINLYQLLLKQKQ